MSVEKIHFSISNLFYYLFDEAFGHIFYKNWLEGEAICTFLKRDQSLQRVER